MIKTKMIATLGPSCTRAETIKDMIDNGVDVFRLNFSHGTLDEHAGLLQAFNTAHAQHHHTTAVMGDLCGPKIRIGLIDPERGVLGSGDTLSIVPGDGMGSADSFGTNYEYFAKDVIPRPTPVGLRNRTSFPSEIMIGGL